jgi:hypothetical protein
MEPVDYQMVPSHITADIVAARQRELEEEK